MNFAFSEEQDALRDSARRFLEDKCGSPVVRSLMETEKGFDDAMWRQMAELGWHGMAIPEEYGGVGYSWIELIVLLEEMGRALLPAPFFSSVVLAANVILNAGSADQKKSLLPGIASGETIATLALTEANGRWDASGIELRASGGKLTGTKTFVLDGHVADTLVVAARDGERGEDARAGISLYVVKADAPGVTRRPLATMDLTRKQAEITFAEAPGELLGEAGTGWAAVQKTLDQACVAIAAEQVGGAQRCLDMSVAYAKVRVQFGRPIGSFQAIKHKCADMLLEVESSKSAAYYAAWAAAEDNDELPVVSSLAKAYCSDAYFHCAAENIQIHGGIGFTWEHDAHLYFKRAKTDEVLFGDATYHRELLAQRIGL